MKLGLYQHYSGRYYHVLGVARHSETYEEMAVYQRLYSDYGIWVRPLAMFQETVTIDGQEKPRFQFIQELLTTAPSYDPA